MQSPGAQGAQWDSFPRSDHSTDGGCAPAGPCAQGAGHHCWALWKVSWCERQQSGLWPCLELRDDSKVLRETWKVPERSCTCLQWPWPSFSVRPRSPSACCKPAWKVSKGSSHPLKKYHVDIAFWKKGMNNNSGWLIKSNGMPEAPKLCRQRLADTDFSNSCIHTSLCNSTLGGRTLRGRHASQSLCRHLSHGSPPCKGLGIGFPGDVQKLWAYFCPETVSKWGVAMGQWVLAQPPSGAACEHGQETWDVWGNNTVLLKWPRLYQPQKSVSLSPLPERHSSLYAT